MQLIKNGLGMFVDADFVVPQNPIVRAAQRRIAVQAEGGAVVKTGVDTGMGMIVDAAFPYPQNPIRGNTSLTRPISLLAPQMNALDSSLLSLRCGACATPSLQGLGAFDVSDIESTLGDFFSGTTFGISNGILAAGAIAAFLLLGSRGGGRASYRYERQKVLRDLGDKYPRYGTRAVQGARGVAARVRRIGTAVTA